MSAVDSPGLSLDFNALRGPRAVSPVTYLVAALGLFLSSFEFELVLPGSGPADALVIATTTTVASVLVLFVADKTVLRHRHDHRLSLALVLGVYIVCGVVRALVSSVSAAAVDARGPELTARSLGGIVLVVAWLSIIAIVLDYADRDRETTTRLRARQAQLTRQRDHYGIALAQGRDSIAALVDSVAGPAIAQSEALMGRIATGGSSVGNAVDAVDYRIQAEQLSELAFGMRDRAEGQVRSLSHMLASPEPQFNEAKIVVSSPTLDSQPTSHWIVRALKQATVLDPIQPTAVTLTVLVEAVPLLAYLFGFRGLVQCAVIGSVVTFTFLVLARRVVTPRLRRWNQATRIVVLLGVAVVAGILGTGSIYLWYPAERDVIFAIALRCIWVFVIAMIAWAFIASSAAQSIRAQRELAATVAEIEWETDGLREELARVQRSAAEIVHGRVQGRIIAAALLISMQARKLDQGQSAAAAETPRALADAAAILGEARDDVRAIQEYDASARSIGIVELVQAVGRAWRGVVGVDVVIEKADAQKIDRSDSLCSRVAEVVREAVSNAARHGAARSVRIEVSTGDGTVVITAADDGLGVRTDVEAGLGLGQVTRANGEWTLVDGVRGGSVLTVALPRT